MKVAIAKNGNTVSGHFGHCEGFETFEVKDGVIEERSFIPSPEHQPGILPPFLADKGVNVIIAGGMGGAAVELFKERGITVIIGAQGNLDDVIKQYLSGELKSTVSACEEHHH